MRFTIATATAVLSALQAANAQTFTACDPTKKTCPGDSGIGNGKPFVTDFTTVSGTDAPTGWTYADGTTMSYDSANGANFQISTKTGAPTISTSQYIMFGNVSTYAKASPGTGIVSSFILESDDLDEIDWEWLGSNDASVESNFFGKGNVTSYDRAIYHPISQAVTGWHTYTIEWTKDYVKWYVDDMVTPVRILAYDDPKTIKGTQFPQTPMKIKLGNWVGCADAAAAADPKTQGTCEWAGGPASFDGSTSYSMYVKNISISDAGCGGTYTYSDMTGSFDSIKSSNEGASCGSSGSSSSPSSSAGSSSAASSTTASATDSASTVSSGTTSTASAPNSTTTASISTSTVPAGVSPSSENATATGSSSGSGSNGTSTGSGSTGGATASAAGGASSSSTSTPQITTNSASSHKYGTVELVVMAFGLGVGYLVM
ncbi:putative glycosidase [Lachnellula hyalina]|uniref:Putative glycosidase n=1 Tax=Lachnellula hyalina TaxID=1316788 RepID=A0A8H8R725_9HELO|nr:putative glycosidase [Lachnellula hyalina]TVY28725.1 putative glycosidase [Lachnellula hyalina]